MFHVPNYHLLKATARHPAARHDDLMAPHLATLRLADEADRMARRAARRAALARALARVWPGTHHGRHPA